MNADMTHNMLQIAHFNQMLTKHVNNIRQMEEMERHRETLNAQAQQRAAILQKEYEMLRRRECEILMSQQLEIVNASMMQPFGHQYGHIETLPPYQCVVEPRVIGKDSLEQGLVSEQESFDKKSFVLPDFHEIDERQQYNQAYPRQRKL